MRCTSCGATFDLRGHADLIDDEMEERLAYISVDRC
ncbi:dual CXXC motif small (seleno)protein [Desulfovibrio sp. X2]